MALPKLGYCIVVVRGGRACTLDGMAVSLDKGPRNYPKGLHLGGNKDGYSHLEELSEEQLLLTFRFTEADVTKKPDGAGELVVKRAELVSKDELLPEDNFAGILDGPIAESLIMERLSFDQLLRYSDPKRVARADTVRGPALKMTPAADSNYWWFNFKSFPSTTGLRHKGFIRFIKPRGMVDPAERRPLEQVHCEVDCQCPDFKYRWAWSNKQRQASRVGANSLNQCINRAPRITNPTNRPGLCKHLLALRNFIYGQAFAMTGRTADPSDRMDKLVKHSQKRWLDFDGEVFKAREKERQRTSAMNTLRRDPLRADGPVPQIPQRIGDMPVPEPPAIDGDLTDLEPAPASTPLEQIQQAIENPPEEPPVDPASTPSTSPVPPRTGGYASPAEFNYRRRIGDSSYQQRHATMKKLLQEAHRNMSAICEEDALPTEQAVSADPTASPLDQGPEDGLTVLCEIRDMLATLFAEEDPTAAPPDDMAGALDGLPEPGPEEEPAAEPEAEGGDEFGGEEEDPEGAGEFGGEEEEDDEEKKAKDRAAAAA